MATPRFTQADEEELIGRALAALGPAFTNWLAQQQGGIEELIGAENPPPVPPGAPQAAPQGMPPGNDPTLDALARYGLI